MGQTKIVQRAACLSLATRHRPLATTPFGQIQPPLTHTHGKVYLSTGGAAKLSSSRNHSTQSGMVGWLASSFFRGWLWPPIHRPLLFLRAVHAASSPRAFTAATRRRNYCKIST